MALPLDDSNENNNAALNRFFEPEDALPTFTQALRGYHKDEVDQYLREVREARDQDAQAIADAEAETRDMQLRVATLEKTLGAETPHTIEALGERLVLILRHAEEGAQEALAQAQEEADRLSKEARERADAFVRQASLRATQAAQELKNARREAEEMTTRSERDAEELQARSEADANEKAMSIVNEAQVKAAERIADAEQQAYEIGEKSRLERIKAEEGIDEIRRRGEEELRRLVARRQEIIDSLGDIRSTIGTTLSSDWADPVDEWQTRSFSVDDLHEYQRSVEHEGSASHSTSSHGLSSHSASSHAPSSRSEESLSTTQFGTFGEGSHSVETFTANKHRSESSPRAVHAELDETGEDEAAEDEEL